jgi:hypothetical protein
MENTVLQWAFKLNGSQFRLAAETWHLEGCTIKLKKQPLSKNNK